MASHGNDPLPEWGGVEPTFGIFSCTRPIAKGFLRQIKREFESNSLLLELFPDVVWDNASRDAPKWSEDDGLVLKRKSNPKESTLEAWGLVDGQPTSKHFTVRVYDDVVTLDSVRSPDMIKKTTESWEMSLNLGAMNGYERYIGTRYHLFDTYSEIIKREGAQVRAYPATDDGTLEGIPVLLDYETLEKKRKRMGSFTFACQMLQDPQADKNQSFKVEWIQKYQSADTKNMRVIILCDPANEKRKHSDYTSIWVIGIGEDENFYILDGIRDRLSLTERWQLLKELHQEWRPQNVYYERYGMQADIEYFKVKMDQDVYRFSITPVGGTMAKNDRIRRLIPLFEEGRVYFPERLIKRDYEWREYDLVKSFIEEEYTMFPLVKHDDMLDALARLTDEEVDTSKPNNNWKKPLNYPKRHRV